MINGAGQGEVQSLGLRGLLASCVGVGWGEECFPDKYFFLFLGSFQRLSSWSFGQITTSFQTNFGRMVLVSQECLVRWGGSGGKREAKVSL